ncbi:hypothetical protein AB0E69_37300 [Kribbella sp. NPDC026611]|uniref:hypothetical protein n=1 Tax=Kribbella sp. NPDC026611 TaxID=3154911 RepID=UPI0033D46833
MAKFLGFLLGVAVALAGPAVFGVLAAPGGVELNAKGMALAFGIGALVFWAVVSYFSGAGALGAFVAFGTLVYCWLWIPNRTTNFLNDVPGVTNGMIEGSKQYTLNGVVPILTVISLVYAIQLIVRSAQRRRRERAEAERLQREQEAAQAQQEADAAAVYPVAGGTYQAENSYAGTAFGNSNRYDDLFDEPEPVRPRSQAEEQTDSFPADGVDHTAEYPDAHGNYPDDGDATVLVPTDRDETMHMPHEPEGVAPEDTAPANQVTRQHEPQPQDPTEAVQPGSEHGQAGRAASEEPVAGQSAGGQSAGGQPVAGQQVAGGSVAGGSVDEHAGDGELPAGSAQRPEAVQSEVGGPVEPEGGAGSQAAAPTPAAAQTQPPVGQEPVAPVDESSRPEPQEQPRQQASTQPQATTQPQTTDRPQTSGQSPAPQQSVPTQPQTTDEPQAAGQTPVPEASAAQPQSPPVQPQAAGQAAAPESAAAQPQSPPVQPQAAGQAPASEAAAAQPQSAPVQPQTAGQSAAPESAPGQSEGGGSQGSSQVAGQDETRVMPVGERDATRPMPVVEPEPPVAQERKPEDKMERAPVVGGKEQMGSQYRERMDSPEDTGEFHLTAFENPVIKPA